MRCNTHIDTPSQHFNNFSVFAAEKRYNARRGVEESSMTFRKVLFELFDFAVIRKYQSRYGGLT